jgi:hypothetical protein
VQQQKQQQQQRRLLQQQLLALLRLSGSYSISGGSHGSPVALRGMPSRWQHCSYSCSSPFELALLGLPHHNIPCPLLGLLSLWPCSSRLALPPAPAQAPRRWPPAAACNHPAGGGSEAHCCPF